MAARRAITFLLATAAIVPLAAAPVSAATPVVGISGSMSEWVPPIVGNNDGWGATVQNTGTADEIVTVAVTRYDAATPPIAGSILSPATFKLAPGASCLVAVRWVITPAQAASPSGYRAAFSAVAGLATPPVLTGTGVNVKAGIGMSKKIAPSVYNENVFGGNGILSKPQTICGTTETFMPPRQVVAGYNELWTGATKRGLWSGVDSSGQALVVRNVATYASDFWGRPLANGQVPAVITPSGGGTKGWKLPATGRCIISTAISGLVLGQATTTIWQAAVPLGSTGGVVYGNYRDTVTGAVKPSSFVDNGGWVPGGLYPACAPAN